MNPLPPRNDSGWIQTYTGRQFWPLNPEPADIDIMDIAHALSMKCRFTGHCARFYSVAQHSTLAALACADARQSITTQLWALLHDASEAYLPDVARPIKPMLTGFRQIENHLMNAIAQRFRLPPEMPAIIKEIDLRLLATERRDLMSAPPIPWLATENVEPYPAVIEAHDPLKSRTDFLKAFDFLTNLREAEELLAGREQYAWMFK